MQPVGHCRVSRKIFCVCYSMPTSIDYGTIHNGHMFFEVGSPAAGKTRTRLSPWTWLSASGCLISWWDQYPSVFGKHVYFVCSMPELPVTVEDLYNHPRSWKGSKLCRCQLPTIDAHSHDLCKYRTFD